jgi:exosortase A-associated hydrolase 2
MSILEQSGYINVSGRAIYGTHYLPAEMPLRAALLLAEPFGEEKRCAFRMLVRLARQLAARGVAVMRYDAGGTGDSAGKHREAEWRHWQDELAAQIALARELPGKPPLMLAGARAGALLAAEAAARSSTDGDGIQALILLEPLLSGDELLRDLERRQKIKDMMSGGAKNAAATELWAANQAADFGGFMVGLAMAEQLRRAQLLTSVAATPADCALQLLRVSGAKNFPPAWQDLVAAVTARAGSSAEVIADKPFWGQLDYYESDVVIDAVTAFVASHMV